MTRKENDFDKLARLIKHESEEIRAELGGEFGRVRSELNNRIEGLEYKVDSGFARVDQELASVRSELKSFRIDMTELQEMAQTHEGYAREIDHVLQRTVAIEKHLGIKRPRVVKR